jgi:hypothetical protein
MITLDDIEDITDLTRDEIAAVAEHEHLGIMAATLLGDYLMHRHHGPARIQKMICDDIRRALHKDDLDHARALFATLRQYMSDHPEAARGVPPSP